MKIDQDNKLVVITSSAGGIGEKIQDVFSISFALRLGFIGVTCNNVPSDYIKTNFDSGSLNHPDPYKNRAGVSMLNRWGCGAEIAAVFSFLASDNARFISGQDIYIDGGWLTKGFN
jgi:NAD(P)-dependent dehydrogenase (short-subunit alcohol dehydrogenase family)